MLIKDDFKLAPLKLSERAWCWFGPNFIDGELSMEELSIRFKTNELANQFRQVVENVVTTIKEIQETKLSMPQIPSTVDNYGIEEVSGDEDANNAEEEGEEEIDEEEDEEDLHYDYEANR